MAFRNLWRRRIQITESGCWQWIGHRDRDGYARANIRGRYGLAHRLVYAELRGPIPNDMTLDHTCHSQDKRCSAGSRCPHRACVNPDHLEPVSHAENVARSLLPRTHCKRGHSLDDGNAYVSPSGQRGCRACRRDAAKSYRQRKGPS